MKIIDTLFESMASLIGNRDSLASQKGKKMESIVSRLRAAVA